MFFCVIIQPAMSEGSSLIQMALFQSSVLRTVLAYYSASCVREAASLNDDDVELNVLGCRVDILGTNCDHA